MIATEADLNKLYARQRRWHKTEFQTLQAVLKECRQQKLTTAILKGKGINTAVLRTEFKAISLKLSHRLRVVPQRRPGEKVLRFPLLELVELLVKELLEEYDGYAPLFEFRQRTRFFDFEEQNSHLYRLEKAGKIELSSLQETRRYSKEQIAAGIPQPLVGEIPGPPLFFIKAAS